MSGGEQQMLAMGRALMADPTLLLLDEPSMGLAPILVDRIYETVREINKQGTTILLVEQNANYALEVSTRGYVLETGKVVLADKSAALRDNPEVQNAYLGAWRMTVFALIGSTALWLLYSWLLSAIVASYLSGPQGLRPAPGPRQRAAAQRPRRRDLARRPGQGPSRCGRSRPVGPRWQEAAPQAIAEESGTVRAAARLAQAAWPAGRRVAARLGHRDVTASERRPRRRAE